MFWLVRDLQQIAFFMRFIRMAISPELGGFHALGEKQSNLAPAAFGNADRIVRPATKISSLYAVTIIVNILPHVTGCWKRGCQSLGRERSRLNLRFQF
jgi:hypothetical protein